jgi:hypothetical protein
VANDAFRSYQDGGNKSRGALGFSLSTPNLKIGDTSRRNSAANAPPSPTQSVVSPHDHLRMMHERAGRPFATRPALSVPDFFVQGSQEDYDMAVVQAVRSGNLDLIRSLRDDHGRNLQCCNKFGESIVHTVARHGAVPVLELLAELGVSFRVCCDSGRTPLSDASWTQAPPNLGMVERLLDDCPDLLYLTDRRGLAPLNYVPREHWAGWCEYLDRRGLDRLVPVQPPHHVAP